MINIFLRRLIKPQPALPPTTAPRLYANNQMPDDLQAAEKLAVATIFGTGSRFQFAAPKCRL
jgi:hypothetical protein